MDYSSFFHKSLEHLKLEGRYRYFKKIERCCGDFPHAYLYQQDLAKEKIIVWCGNDYLGMSQNPHVIEAMKATIDKVGTGSGGTRNISGTTIFHEQLEHEIASLHGKESALVFTSGYVANEATLTTLGRMLPNCAYISDADNHASIIQGIRYSGAEKHIFKHNDLTDLENCLKKIDHARPKIIVFESIYSMSGNVAPIGEICRLARQYNALTYLDEVHGVGMYGEHGAGVAEQMHLMEEVDIIQGTLGKAFGLIGGYIAAKKEITDFIRSFASGFIFTTSLPPCIAAGAVASIQYLKTHDKERRQQQENVANLKRQFQARGIHFLDNKSHIVPVIIGDAHTCKELADYLLTKHHVYVQPINYPTVPKGTERLRLTPSAVHTPAMVDHLVQAVDDAWRHFTLKKEAA